MSRGSPKPPEPADLVPLSEAAGHPLTLVGGKARTLGRLREAGLPVPEGYVLTPDLLGDPRRLERAVSAVAEALAPSAVAVRSSASAEDGSAASFAGQLETVLGVRGAEALEEAVHRCRAAASAEHVGAYQDARKGDGPAASPDADPSREPAAVDARNQERGSTSRPLHFALLLQRMIRADAAGVAFTADPRTGARDAVVVEAVEGLGESLVSGRRTPERWRVTDEGARREGKSGGDRDLGDEEAPPGVLTADAAAEVAALAREAETLLGGPQDVEWAIADGELHLLQSRPVTAGLDRAPPVEIEEEPPDSGFWFRDAAHYPRPFHPLFGSIYIPFYEEAVSGAFEEFGLLIEGLRIREVGGWPYSRIVPPGDGDGAAPPPWLLWIASRLAPPLRKRMRRAREARKKDLEGRYVHRWWEEWRPELDRWIRRTDAVDRRSLDQEALAAHYRGAVEMFGRALRIHFKLFPPFFLAVTDLVFFCRDELGWEKGRATQLLAGESGSSSEPGRALEALARRASETPAAREALSRPGPEALERLRERAPEVAAAFDDHQERYGLRVLDYDFGTPTFRERPELVLGFLRNQLEREATGAHARVDELRERRVREARDELAGRPDARRRFEELLERAHRAYPVREDNEFFALSILGLLRFAAQEVGQRMVEAGHLDRPGQVHFLRHEEVIGWLAEPRDVRVRARRREGERRWALANPGPPSYGEDPGPPPDPSPLPDAGRRVLRALLWMVDNDLDAEPPDESGLAGVGASPGTYTGPVRVVRSEEEFEKVRAGDVLVCPVTSPTWSVLFPSVGALVTDDGGLLSHPAIIAREFGVPAVLATKGATTELSDGEMVTVDGTTGRVERC